MRLILHRPGHPERDLQPGERPPVGAWVRPEPATTELLGVLLCMPHIQHLHLREPDPALLPLLGALPLLGLRLELKAAPEGLVLPTGLLSLELRDCPVQDLDFLRPLRALQTLNLTGTHAQHSSLPAIAHLPLQRLDLSRTPLLDMAALRARLEALSIEDMGARMALSEAWEDVIEFKFEAGFGDFYVEELDPEAIPLGDDSEPAPGTRAPWERWHILRSSAEVFGLDLSQLAGEMPGLATLSGMATLRSLDLSDTPFDHLHLLGQLPALQHLGLGMTRVQSLSALSGMPALRSLDLSGAPVRELVALSELRELEGLRLSRVHLDPAAATALAQCTTLQHLALHEATFTQGALGHLGALPALLQLSLHGSDLLDADLARLAQATTLRDLDMTRCSLADQAPALRLFTQLRSLSLRKSSLSDEHLGYLSGLGQLERLSLAFCRATQGPCEQLAKELAGVEVSVVFEEG